MITFNVLGKVRGKGRPRFQRIGNFVRTYTDKDTTTYENLVKFSFIESGCKRYESDKQLVAYVYIFITPPKSTSKKKLEEMLSNKIRPAKKPDIDNVLKSIFDGLNKVAYEDDTQIVEVHSVKCYSMQERVEVRICELGELERIVELGELELDGNIKSKQE